MIVPDTDVQKHINAYSLLWDWRDRFQGWLDEQLDAGDTDRAVITQAAINVLDYALEMHEKPTLFMTGMGKIDTYSFGFGNIYCDLQTWAEEQLQRMLERHQRNVFDKELDDFANAIIFTNTVSVREVEKLGRRVVADLREAGEVDDEDYALYLEEGFRVFLNYD